ncbi:MAG: glycine cleavage system protein H [Desulfuromonas sp.]|nr:MAG: glycine cleavage system protein H [Desulfuromonas sp.]
MDFPDDLKYTEEHEWILLEEEVATVGITDFAQDQLGDVVFVEIPEVGTKLEAGKAFGVVESVKAVSDIYAPLSGEVVEVNEELVDAPEVINTSAYEDGWMIKIQVSDMSQVDELLDAEAYQALVENEG